MYYIQRKGHGGLETVDETASLKDAKFLLKEYIMSEPTASYYLSQRACKDWRESNKAFQALQ
jgi:hypothetical protein